MLLADPALALCTTSLPECRPRHVAQDTPLRRAIAERVGTYYRDWCRSYSGVYYPNTREIHVKPPSAFFSPSDHAHVLLHEAAHAVGHRLERPAFEERRYHTCKVTQRIEEVTAELTASLSMISLGLIPDHAPHVLSSVQRLSKGDPDYVKTAWDDAVERARIVVAWCREACTEQEKHDRGLKAA